MNDTDKCTCCGDTRGHGVIRIKEEYIQKRQGKGKAKPIYFLPEAPMQPKYELGIVPGLFT